MRPNANNSHQLHWLGFGFGVSLAWACSRRAWLVATLKCDQYIDGTSGQPNTVSVWFWQKFSAKIYFGFGLSAFFSFGDSAERRCFGRNNCFGQKRMLCKPLIFNLSSSFHHVSAVLVLFSVSLSPK